LKKSTERRIENSTSKQAQWPGTTLERQHGVLGLATTKQGEEIRGLLIAVVIRLFENKETHHRTSFHREDGSLNFRIHGTIAKEAREFLSVGGIKGKREFFIRQKKTPRRE